MSCSAVDCPNDSAIAWERWMTEDEIAFYHESGDLPLHETSGKLMVYACAEHELADPDDMAVTHDATCTAPPVCDCSVASG